LTNPYAPPTTECTPRGSCKLYSPGHVAWATFLGSPIAGCVLLAMNYRRLGDMTAAITALVSGFIVTSLTLVIAFFLPDNFPSSILSMVSTATMYQVAKSLQNNAYERHLAKGGSKASTWGATGVGVLCMVCILVVIFGVVIASPPEWFGEQGLVE
jgi:putative Ca2+/H+ antiporter (TMEM165/GDT1 family)